MPFPDSAKEFIREGRLGHLVTSNPNGTPQVTCVWVAVESDDLLTAHLNPRKLQNVRRDPRVAVSFEGTKIHPPGLREYLVVHGRATIEEGGAPELLQELARVHLGPDVRFPRWTTRRPASGCWIAVERVTGIGPWSE
jgi:PPOX class probable F420-dependent enzyme